MTIEQLFAEALATLPVLLRAGAVWLVLLCGVAGLAVYAVVVAVVCACRWVCGNLGPRKALSARLPASEPESDPASASEAERRSEPRISAAPS